MHKKKRHFISILENSNKSFYNRIETLLFSVDRKEVADGDGRSRKDPEGQRTVPDGP